MGNEGGLKGRFWRGFEELRIVDCGFRIEDWFMKIQEANLETVLRSFNAVFLLLILQN